MIGAVIILLVTVFVGVLLYVCDLKYRRKHPESKEDDKNRVAEEGSHGEICCGRHLICEKPLSPKVGEKIIYYDDEELDRFAGRDADGYSPDEIDEVRSVMITLLQEDIPGWVRSMQLRGINLPTPLRDELFILLDC